MLPPNLKCLVYVRIEFTQSIRRLVTTGLTPYGANQLRRKVTRSLRFERNQHLNQVIGDIQTNPKPFWNYIRSQRKDNQVMLPLKTPAGTTVDSDYEKAELNAQFQNHWSHEDTNSVPFLRNITPGIGNIVVTTNGLIKLVKDLKQSKSAGPDEIHPHVLKGSSAQVAPFLKYIFQKSLETSKLPEDWRVATICPIYKKGDRSCPNNYRPVSLTSVVCKVLEHKVCSNCGHLDAHGLITNMPFINAVAVPHNYVQ